MDDQSARVLLLAVPPAKVVSAVTGVEPVLEIDVEDLADHALRDHLPHLCRAGAPSVVEGYPQLPTGPLYGVDDEVALLHVYRHRLFRDCVATQLHRPDHVLVVEGVYGGDDDDVGFRLLDHSIEIVRDVRGYFVVVQFIHKTAIVIREPAGVGIGESDQLAFFTELGRGVYEHSRS